MENNNKNNILFDDSLKSNYFKLRYSFPFIEKAPYYLYNYSMYILRALYIVLALTSVACIVAGAKQKRRNIGFLLTAGIIAVSDLICAFLVGAENPKQAGRVLLPYYVLHAWFLFAMLIMIILIDRYRQFLVALIISAGVCLYQTYLVIAQYRGERIFSFQKRVYFRKAWWVATDTKNTGFFMSFRSYRSWSM